MKDFYNARTLYIYLDEIIKGPLGSEILILKSFDSIDVREITDREKEVLKNSGFSEDIFQIPICTGFMQLELKVPKNVLLKELDNKKYEALLSGKLIEVNFDIKNKKIIR